MANFEPFKCIELFVPWQVVYEYCGKSFINIPTFFNFVPQSFKKTYCVGTTWFYRFACGIRAQAHIFCNDKTDVCGTTKKGAGLWIFPTNFSKVRVFEMLHPHKWYVVLNVFVKKLSYFPKRALHADTTRNEWLKEALLFCWILTTIQISNPDNFSMHLSCKKNKKKYDQMTVRNTFVIKQAEQLKY